MEELSRLRPRVPPNLHRLVAVDLCFAYTPVSLYIQPSVEVVPHHSPNISSNISTYPKTKKNPLYPIAQRSQLRDYSLDFRTKKRISVVYPIIYR
jgi:hypothetical protein